MINVHVMAGPKVLVSGSLYWDVTRDRRKAVEVAVEISPSEIRKMASVTVKLPSIKKV